ncbi:MAG: 50S ribosomal protein L23 [Conexivisphaerales archaeon]
MDINTAHNIIKGVYKTEKSVDLISKENKLAFIVDSNANKHQIKEAIELLYDVKVVQVNVLIGIKGKKAYVKLAPQNLANELATKLSVI